MFQYENSVNGKMDIAKVWELYSDVSRWPEWDSDMEKVELDGAFVAGVAGTMFMSGMPPLPFVLVDVEREQSFINTSTFGDVTVKFGHFIQADGDAMYTLKHTVEITGENEAQLQNIGQGIAKGIPDCMAKLYELARAE